MSEVTWGALFWFSVRWDYSFQGCFQIGETMQEMELMDNLQGEFCIYNKKEQRLSLDMYCILFIY